MCASLLHLRPSFPPSLPSLYLFSPPSLSPVVCIACIFLKERGSSNGMINSWQEEYRGWKQHRAAWDWHDPKESRRRMNLCHVSKLVLNQKLKRKKHAQREFFLIDPHALPIQHFFFSSLRPRPRTLPLLVILFLKACTLLPVRFSFSFLRLSLFLFNSIFQFKQGNSIKTSSSDVRVSPAPDWSNVKGLASSHSNQFECTIQKEKSSPNKLPGGVCRVNKHDRWLDPLLHQCNPS
mmetsp:Transcript_29226/g.57341  ORF Transcript_29226/g.57341 Transcript_29226/m.57341 type:complete len:236 (-) Transcript_29226:1867-2574(-)